MEATMNTETRENVLAAMHGEAFAYARYTLFAAAARDVGDQKLAATLEGIASVELHEHFAELAELIGFVGSDADNLATAIQEESAEVEETYRAFAEQARAVGEQAAAARFDEICADELEHLKTLETAMEELEVPA
jgi:Rubrerythrin